MRLGPSIPSPSVAAVKAPSRKTWDSPDACRTRHRGVLPPGRRGPAHRRGSRHHGGREGRSSGGGTAMAVSGALRTGARRRASQPSAVASLLPNRSSFLTSSSSKHPLALLPYLVLGSAQEPCDLRRRHPARERVDQEECVRSRPRPTVSARHDRFLSARKACVLDELRCALVARSSNIWLWPQRE